MKYNTFSTVLSYRLEKLFLTRGPSQQIQIQAYVTIQAGFATGTTSYIKVVFVNLTVP